MLMRKKEQEAANEMVYGLSARGRSIGLWRHVLWISDPSSAGKNLLAFAACCLHSSEAFVSHSVPHSK